MGRVGHRACLRPALRWSRRPRALRAAQVVAAPDGLSPLTTSLRTRSRRSRSPARRATRRQRAASRRPRPGRRCWRSRRSACAAITSGSEPGHERRPARRRSPSRAARFSAGSGPRAHAEAVSRCRLGRHGRRDSRVGDARVPARDDSGTRLGDLDLRPGKTVDAYASARAQPPASDGDAPAFTVLLANDGARGAAGRALRRTALTAHSRGRRGARPPEHDGLTTYTVLVIPGAAARSDTALPAGLDLRSAQGSRSRGRVTDSTGAAARRREADAGRSVRTPPRPRRPTVQLPVAACDPQSA